MNSELSERVKRIKEDEGKTVGLVQGSYDLFHLGHLKYLLEARKRCDYLIIGVDSDEKIRKRKGIKRPIIPYVERSEFIELLDIADEIIEKKANEPKWGLIKTIKPDVLIAIEENYKPEELEQLKQYCGKVDILPRQSTNSTSDIIRKTLIANGVRVASKNDLYINNMVEEFKKRIGFNMLMPEPIPMLVDQLKKSTDKQVQVAACCKVEDKWVFGSNQIDLSLSMEDVENRSELFYSTVEHAEINMLKQIPSVEKIDSPVYTTLFPCDKCMKVLISKGVKEIYYIEDHPDRNWSKRSHELANKHGVKTIKLFELDESKAEKEQLQLMDSSEYKYIDPRNVRDALQLDIMLSREEKGEDPLNPDIIDQEILFFTDYWYVTKNRFPISSVEHTFLVVSKLPIYNVEDMTKEMWEDLKNIWDKLRNDYNLPGGAICQRFGDTQRSGATLKRIHTHIIVPTKDNKTKFTIGGNPDVKDEIKEDYIKLIKERKTEN